MKFVPLLSLVCVLTCSCGPGGPINPSGTAGSGGEIATGGATNTGVGSGGTGGAGGALPSELPPMWSDGGICSGPNGTGNVVGIGPSLPDEVDAWALICLPAPDGGILHSLRIYPVQGGQCVSLAGEMLLFSAPDGDPPLETPADARLVSLPAPEIPTGDQYVKQTINLAMPFVASPGMLCVGLRLTAEGDKSVCYAQGLKCGTSWLSTTENPYAWTSQPHIPIVGINID